MIIVCLYCLSSDTQHSHSHSLHSARDNDKTWETIFGELLAYRSKHHTCNVPTKGTNLGRWVSKMRKQYKTYDLCKEKPDGWNEKMESRYLRLKEAGFVFCGR